MKTGRHAGSTFSGPTVALEQNIPPGCVAVEGRHDCRTTVLDVPQMRVMPAPPPTPEAVAAEMAAQARAHRSRLLAACDWTALPDALAALGDKAQAWMLYRAELRAVPQQPGFPATINWPKPPGGA